MRMDTAAVGRRFETPTICAPRRRLVKRLLDALPAGTVTFGNECSGVADRGEHVEAAFTDGSTYEADLIVGADGRESLMRRQLWARPNTRPRAGPPSPGRGRRRPE
ncbi:FAD-dependent oxidoreductase [Nonomuraea sp. NBC_00507]|uniref:FAD-dependent oxidoreductase n=1 Tax=Nonomuraea sp. NBC_00507 TaxID=2976002 RepID=UPI003FA5FDF0